MAEAEEATEAVVPPPPVEENESVLILDRGTLVRLHGLQAVAMNGKTGTVLKYETENDPSARRYQVAIDDPKVIDDKNKLPVVRIKPENLAPISFVESMKLQGLHIVKCTPFEITNPSTENLSSTNTSTPSVRVLGGGPYNPSGHVDFLPRNAKLPSRKFIFHNDICEKFVKKLYNEGDFVVAWRFVHVEGKSEIKRRFIEFRCGFEESHVRECFPNDEHLSPVLKRGPFLVLIRVNVFTVPLLDDKSSPLLDLSQVPGDLARLLGSHKQRNFQVTKEVVASLGMDKDERVSLQDNPNELIVDFRQGCAADTFHDMSYRLLHHIFRQHGAKFPPDLPCHFLSVISPFYAPNHMMSGAKNKKKLLEYLDLQVTRADVEASVQGFTYSDRLSNVGEALEALEHYEVAGRVYVWAADNYRELPNFPELNSEWQTYMNGAIAYRRAKIAAPAEHFYVKALHWKYKRDGNRLVIHDSNFVLLMQNMLSMYSFFAGVGDNMIVNSVVSKDNQTWYNCQLIGILQTLLHVARFQTGDAGFEIQAHKNSLKPQYRKPSAALAVLSEACRPGTVEGFRSKIMSCMVGDAVQFLYRQDPALASQCRSPLDRAKDVIQGNCDDHMATSMITCSLSGCQNHEILDTTMVQNSGKFMQCPCRTATYCSKACQTAHWKVHKKSCPVHLAKKKQK